MAQPLNYGYDEDVQKHTHVACERSNLEMNKDSIERSIDQQHVSIALLIKAMFGRQWILSQSKICDTLRM
jgi:hypothetical protein